MDTIKRSFRTAKYSDFFTFEFRRQAGGHIDIYCVEHPEPAPGAVLPAVHLAIDGKIDVPQGGQPRALDRALVIATVWAERYSHYCRTGVFSTSHDRFSMQQPTDR